MPHRDRASAAAMLFAAAASAEVVDVAENGFAVKQTVRVTADAARAWQAAVDVGKWWDPAHADGVLREQIERYQRYVNMGKP